MPPTLIDGTEDSGYIGVAVPAAGFERYTQGTTPVTDEQFSELRAIQLAQLTLLESMETNLQTLAQAAIASMHQADGPNVAPARQVANRNWTTAKKLVQEAKRHPPAP